MYATLSGDWAFYAIEESMAFYSQFTDLSRITNMFFSSMGFVCSKVSEVLKPVNCSHTIYVYAGKKIFGIGKVEV